MALFLSLACLCVLWADPPPRPQQPSALELVSALETVMTDAIARAEPSVVAIHRSKKDNSQETLAVRGKSRPQSLLNPPFQRPRFQRELEPSNMISFDFGSGVVVGDEGQILTAYHVVRGAAQSDRPGGRSPGVRGRDHRGRSPLRPGRDRAGRHPGNPCSQAQADRPG